MDFTEHELILKLIKKGVIKGNLIEVISLVFFNINMILRAKFLMNRFKNLSVDMFKWDIGNIDEEEDDFNKIKIINDGINQLMNGLNKIKEDNIISRRVYNENMLIYNDKMDSINSKYQIKGDLYNNEINNLTNIISDLNLQIVNLRNRNHRTGFIGRSVQDFLRMEEADRDEIERHSGMIKQHEMHIKELIMKVKENNDSMEVERKSCSIPTLLTSDEKELLIKINDFKRELDNVKTIRHNKIVKQLNLLVCDIETLLLLEEQLILKHIKDVCEHICISI